LRSRLILVTLVAALAAPALAGAAAWRVDPDRSTFAVLVHRAGIASNLAHDHLIVARAPECELDFDPVAPEVTRFAFGQAVLALDVDPPAERQRLAPRLAQLGALSGGLPAIPDEDRRKIRAAMLDARQLFAERFPEIRGELVGVERRGSSDASRVALGWSARLRVVLRGETAETTAPLRWELVDGELVAEALAELRFSDFRIEPYSAALGAVRNADRFHLYVELVARPETP